jgi:DNA segregation ATPase FtsK/SpoIIIE-like protein
MAMQQYLEQQADAVEEVLSAHGVVGRVRGGTLSPRLIHYQLTLPTYVRIADLSPLLPTLAERLKAPAVRLAPDPATGVPTLEVPRPDPTPVRLLPLARSVVEVVPPCTATIGVDTAGTPLLIRLDAPEVGAVLVSGAKGTGKSALLRAIALSLALHNGPDSLRLLFFDLRHAGRGGAKHGTWAGMHDLPHLLTAPIRDGHEAHLRLNWAARLVQRRVDLAADGEPIEGANLVILLDGLDAALAGSEGREIAAALAQITRHGREVGVHVVAATRVAQGLTRLGWGARIVGRQLDATEAQAAAGMAGTGAEGLLGGGDFLVVLGGEVTRFQAAFAVAEEVERTVALLAACAARQRAAANAIPGARPVLQAAAAELPAEGTWRPARRGPFGLLKSGS